MTAADTAAHTDSARAPRVAGETYAELVAAARIAHHDPDWTDSLPELIRAHARRLGVRPTPALVAAVIEAAR